MLSNVFAQYTKLCFYLFFNLYIVADAKKIYGVQDMIFGDHIFKHL